MNHIESFPDPAGLHRALSEFAGARAYLVPMTARDGKVLGNNGDTLMHRVFFELLNELRIEVTDDRAADIVIVPPSGALLESYAFPQLLAERLIGFESRPLVVFPSSAYFPTQDPSFIFHGRTAASHLLLREARSFAHLREKWGNGLDDAGVTLTLDHDVVASGHSYVPQIIGHPARSQHLLVAARRDKESSPTHLSSRANDASVVRVRNAIVEAIPYGRIRTAVARTARRRANDSAAASLLDAVPPSLRASIVGGRRSSRVVSVDASANQFATFAEYARAIANAEVVVTNRLHVGLPAAILGKPVILVEAGYYKLQGVYEQSLRNVPSVTFVPRTESS